MTEKEKRILSLVQIVLPLMSDQEIERFLAFTEGVTMMARRNKAEAMRKGA